MLLDVSFGKFFGWRLGFRWFISWLDGGLNVQLPSLSGHQPFGKLGDWQWVSAEDARGSVASCGIFAEMDKTVWWIWCSQVPRFRWLLFESLFFFPGLEMSRSPDTEKLGPRKIPKGPKEPCRGFPSWQAKTTASETFFKQRPAAARAICSTKGLSRVRTSSIWCTPRCSCAWRPWMPSGATGDRRSGGRRSGSV